jgi:hypothetical protein
VACANSNECKNLLTCTGATCIASLAVIGGTCGANVACAEGYCDTAAGNNKCVALKADAVTCAGNNQCQSYVCALATANPTCTDACWDVP